MEEIQINPGWFSPSRVEGSGLMKIVSGRFFFPGRFYSYKGRFKISVISYWAVFVQKSTREDFLPYKHPLKYLTCTHTEGVIERDNQLTHITKLFIMRSYNESNWTFINHMHYPKSVQIASRLILPIIQDVTSSPPVGK